MPLKQWNQAPCMLPPSCTASSTTAPSTPVIFGLLLCVGLPIGGQLRPPCILFILFCALLHSTPQTMGHCPPTHSTLAAPPIIPPIYRSRQLLVGCCMLLLNGGHLWPRPWPYLCFSIGLVLAPQSTEPAMARAHRMPRACCRLIRSTVVPRFGSMADVAMDRESQNRWRVGRWWLMLVVVCCCCVLCCGLR